MKNNRNNRLQPTINTDFDRKKNSKDENPIITFISNYVVENWKTLPSEKDIMKRFGCYRDLAVDALDEWIIRYEYYSHKPWKPSDKNDKKTLTEENEEEIEYVSVTKEELLTIDGKPRRFPPLFGDNSSNTLKPLSPTYLSENNLWDVAIHTNQKINQMNRKMKTEKEIYKETRLKQFSEGVELYEEPVVEGTNKKGNKTFKLKLVVENTLTGEMYPFEAFRSGKFKTFFIQPTEEVPWEAVSFIQNEDVDKKYRFQGEYLTAINRKIHREFIHSSYELGDLSDMDEIVSFNVSQYQEMFINLDEGFKSFLSSYTNVLEKLRLTEIKNDNGR